MGSFSFCLLSDVEKVRYAKRAAGGEGHGRSGRAIRDAEHCAGRCRDDALVAIDLDAERDA